MKCLRFSFVLLFFFAVVANSYAANRVTVVVNQQTITTRSARGVLKTWKLKKMLIATLPERTTGERDINLYSSRLKSVCKNVKLGELAENYFFQVKYPEDTGITDIQPVKLSASPVMKVNGVLCQELLREVNFHYEGIVGR